MARITSSTKGDRYELEVTSASGHTITIDEPVELGGQNKGMSPDELVIAALAGCTSATIQMYVDRKGWDLKAVHTTITLEKEKPADLPIINRTIVLEGDLTDEQKERILIIANKCPVHKMLSNALEINTNFEN